MADIRKIKVNMLNVIQSTNFKYMKALKLDNLNKNVTFNEDTICVAKGDMGASSHYWMTKDKNILKNTKNIQGPSVQLPNNELIMATEAGELPFGDELSPTAKRYASN